MTCPPHAKHILRTGGRLIQKVLWKLWPPDGKGFTTSWAQPDRSFVVDGISVGVMLYFRGQRFVKLPSTDLARFLRSRARR